MIRSTRGWHLLAALLVAWAGSWASLAGAQAAGDATPDDLPPDVVTTRDGTVLRGTITERIAGQYVVISLPSGESRRLDWAQVAYAGPADDAPSPEPSGRTESAPESVHVEASVQAPPPEPSGRTESAPESVHVEASVQAPQPPLLTAEPEPEGGAQAAASPPQAQIPIHFVSPQIGTTFHLSEASSDGTIQYERLCTAPCTANVEPGIHQLAVEPPGDKPMPATPTLDLEHPATVTGQYIDRTGIRVAGIVALVGGWLSSFAFVLPMITGAVTHGPEKGALIAAAGIHALGSMVFSLVLIFHPDGARVRIR